MTYSDAVSWEARACVSNGTEKPLKETTHVKDGGFISPERGNKPVFYNIISPPEHVSSRFATKGLNDGY